MTTKKCTTQTDIMSSKKIFLKMLFLLLVWSLVIISLLKMKVGNIVFVAQEYAVVKEQGQVVLSKVLQHNETVSIVIDRSYVTDILKDKRTVENRAPSLPLAYLSKLNNFRQKENATCAKYPSLLDLKFQNPYWQTMHTANGTFQLFGAYYDTRIAEEMYEKVHILGMVDNVDMNLTTYCQFWFDGRKKGGQKPVIVQVFKYRYILKSERGDYKQDSYHPILITCQVPQIFYDWVPSSVSLVEHKCDMSTNNLRIIYNYPRDKQKKAVAVCVKTLDFLHEDVSMRLIEWIEMLNILGAHKIYFYSLHLHPNISMVLKYYEQEGKVEVMRLTLPGEQSNDNVLEHIFFNKTTYFKERNEAILYNDCFLKNMFLYDYIALLDIDEIILARHRALAWPKMLKYIKHSEKRQNAKRRQLYYKPKASFCFQNFFFLGNQQIQHGWHKEVPQYMHMLQHVHRANESNGPSDFIKCFFNTQKAVIVHKHFPLSCISSACKSYMVTPERIRLHHYRTDCVKDMRNCTIFRDNAVEDKTIWHYKNMLISRSTKTLIKLGFLERPNHNDTTSSKP